MNEHLADCLCICTVLLEYAAEQIDLNWGKEVLRMLGNCVIVV